MTSEATTRKEIIDSRLKEAGWNVADRTQVFEEYFVSLFGIGHGEPRSASSEGVLENGPKEFSDYVLLGKNGKAIAVIEAKRSSKDAEIGREQAKQWSGLVLSLVPKC